MQAQKREAFASLFSYQLSDVFVLVKARSDKATLAPKFAKNGIAILNKKGTLRSALANYSHFSCHAWENKNRVILFYSFHAVSNAFSLRADDNL